MAPSLLLALKAGAHVVGAGDTLAIRDGDRQVPLGQLPQDLEAAVRRLEVQPTDESSLAESIDHASPEMLFRWHALVADLVAHRVIHATLAYRGRAFASCEPRGHESEPPLPVDPDRRYLQSRFAYVRRDADLQVIETPRASARIVLHDRGAVAAWHAFVEPRTAREAASLTGLDTSLVSAFLEMLSGIEALDVLNDLGEAGEAHDPEFRAWEFHDLLFHGRTRIGRHGQPYGGVYRFRGVFDPPPAVKPPALGEQLALERPDLSNVERRDPTLTRVLEERRSVRADASRRVITARELGEFLYRVARVKSIQAREGYDVTSRVYPGGGAAYELETYLAIRACDGVAAGMYHYQPVDHALARVRDYNEDVGALVNAAGAMAGAGAPQILIILSARFERVTWKYSSMAYAGILKNVGVLYQTMYLVATAMGLSPCALGGGNSDLFARAAGTSFYTETSVGEFTLGGP